jgi:hypothetical protein
VFVGNPRHISPRDSACSPSRLFPSVILSAADRFPPFQEIGPLRFPASGESHLPPRKGCRPGALFPANKLELSPVKKVPRRSRRISLRIWSSGGTGNPRLTSNSRAMRTYVNRQINSFRIRTYIKPGGGGIRFMSYLRHRIVRQFPLPLHFAELQASSRTRAFQLPALNCRLATSPTECALTKIAQGATAATAMDIRSGCS